MYFEHLAVFKWILPGFICFIPPSWCTDFEILHIFWGMKQKPCNSRPYCISESRGLWAWIQIKIDDTVLYQCVLRCVMLHVKYIIQQVLNKILNWKTLENRCRWNTLWIVFCVICLGWHPNSNQWKILQKLMRWEILYTIVCIYQTCSKEKERRHGLRIDTLKTNCLSLKTIQYIFKKKEYRGSPPYAHFGTWKKPCYKKLVLVGLYCGPLLTLIPPLTRT